MPRDTLRPWRMPPTAVDRTGPVSDLGRRNHSTRSPGSDPSGPSASRSASGERQADLDGPGVAALLATDDQGLRKTGVVVGQDRLEPAPVRGRRLVIEVDQPGCQRVAGHRRRRAPRSRRRYSWMPRRAKAHARGEVVSRIGVNTWSNVGTTQNWKSRR